MHFLEEEDSEAMQEELKEAFRLYDREGTSSSVRTYFPYIFFIFFLKSALPIYRIHPQNSRNVGYAMMYHLT